MKEKIALISAFLLIFAFSAIDNSISPMAAEVSKHYQSTLNIILKFISISTIATVIGVFIGPWVLTKVKPANILFISSSLILISQIIFVLNNYFITGLTARFISGFSTGLIASIMWWMSYHWISKRFYSYMIAVLVSARPLATAIGVPLSGIIAFKYSWIIPFIFLSIIVFISGNILSFILKNGEKIEKKGLFEGYTDVFKIPYVKTFYTGFMINKMCYFGFYAICGIWFIKHYKMNLKEISLSLLVIGIFEVLVNFISGWLVKKFGFKRVFDTSILLSFLLFIIFIWGRIDIKISVVMIGIFMLLDRIYSMASVMKIPDMFEYNVNKTIFGSLNTLSMWLGLSIISAISSKILSKFSIIYVEILLLLCFTVGSYLMWYVNKKTIYERNKI